MMGRASSNAVFLLLAVGLVGIVAAVLRIASTDPQGMIIGGNFWWVTYGSRLWPLAVIAAASLCFAAAAPGTVPFIPRSRLITYPARVALLILAGTTLALAMVWVLRAFPNSGDEYAYIFQAKISQAGRFWIAVPPHAEFFQVSHVFAKDGKWVSEYPLGWPVLLAFGNLLGLPYWLIGPLLAGALLTSFALFCWSREGPVGAVVGLLILAPTPFFAFNGGSYFTHIPAALFGMLFCQHASAFLDQPRVWRAALAGVALGVLGAIRPFDVLFFALPFGVEWLIRARQRHWMMAPVLLACGVPFLLAYLWQNGAVTGNPLQPIVMWGTPLFRVGLHPVNDVGVPQDLSELIRAMAVRIVELGEWTSPLLVVGYVPALLLQMVRRRVHFVDFVVPCAVIAYLGYPNLEGNRYGPRYYFDAFPLLVFTVTAVSVELMRQPRWQAWVRNLICAHVLTSLVALASLSISFRQIVDERMDLYDTVREQHLHHAVVIIRSGTIRSHAGVVRFMLPTDLTRNGLDLSSDVIYARNLPERTAELVGMFPDRHFYAYDRPDDQRHGSLTPQN